MQVYIRGDYNAEIWNSNYKDWNVLFRLLKTGFYGTWGKSFKVHSSAWTCPDGECVDLTDYSMYALDKFLKVKGMG